MRHNPIIYIILLTACSCIRNDVPYPAVVPGIKSISIEGAESVEINSGQRSIVARLKEQTDICAVRINGAVFDPESTQSTPPVQGTWDLSSPRMFTLSVYDDFVWKLSAVQDIECFFEVEGQVGSSVVDYENCRAIAYVSPRTPLSKINVSRYKLGPEGISSYSRDLTQIHDFSEYVNVDVTAHGRTRSWKLFVEQTSSQVELTAVNPWTRVVWLTASGTSGKDNGFRFKQSDSKEWTEVPKEAVISEGGTFSTCIDGLQPLTDYICQAYSGSDVTEETPFSTQAEQQLPNSDFEVYSNAESDNYFSLYDPAHSLWNAKWWDSGNAGSTMVGASASICAPDSGDKASGNVSVRMNSRYVVIKFAAGNMFSGSFAGLVGTNGGKVNFGRPFSLRPRKLVLMLKYNSGAVDYIGGYPDGAPVSIGDPDCCEVFVALGDWDYHKWGGTKESPIQVNTTDRSTFFNPHSEAVIAYGSFISDRSVTSWQKVEIPLEYTSYSRVPTHIIISCAASRLGDYFTGSSSSILWVDDMVLEY